MVNDLDEVGVVDTAVVVDVDVLGDVGLEDPSVTAKAHIR